MNWWLAILLYVALIFVLACINFGIHVFSEDEYDD